MDFASYIYMILLSIDLLIDFILSFFNMIKLLLNNIINVKKYKTINFIKKNYLKI